MRTAFYNLHRSGLIYRGERIINWCPRCQTALSDLEVEHHDHQGNLWYVRYPLLDGEGNVTDDFITIATTRPETIVADTGIAVSPQTPVEEIYPYLEGLDEVIVMSVHPGWAGQSFLPEALPKIAAVRREIDRLGLSTEVEVDGGVKLDNARRCVEAGASIITAASAIFQAPDPADAARALAEIARGA